MRKLLYVAAAALFATPLFAQTADDIIAHYLKTLGGADKVAAIKTIRRTGKYTGGGGFEAPIAQQNKRPNKVREEFTMQGLTGINAFDGSTGWKIEPWDGKKDAEALGEEEMIDIQDDADIDGPLVNYQQKGNKVEYAGTDSVEGTDTYKLRVTSPNGEVRTYYMDQDSYVPIKVDLRRIVRGAEREYELWPGDYKQSGGVYFPYSLEINTKRSQFRQKYNYDKIETNVPLDDAMFVKPGSAK
jgi:hypothetical protein